MVYESLRLIFAKVLQRLFGGVFFFLSDISISSGLSLKHIPIITGKFVLAIHWIGEGYQISALSVV